MLPVSMALHDTFLKLTVKGVCPKLNPWSSYFPKVTQTVQLLVSPN